MNESQVEEHFVPLVLHLSKADWFTSKVSATGLYSTPYKKAAPAMQQTLRQHFGALVHDETPMVRRQAANNLAKFAKEMDTPVIIDEMIPLFQYLASDDQDSVRLLTVDILISIAEEIPKEQQPSHGVLLTSLRALFEDKSWRVRYMVADRYEKVRFLALIRNLDAGTVLNSVIDCQGRARGSGHPRYGARFRETFEGY